MANVENSTFIIILVVLYFLMEHNASAYLLSDVRRLKEKILKDNVYDRKLRPTQDQTKPTEVTAFMAIFSIHSLDIMSGQLLAPGYLVATWTDEQLIWNASDYNDLKEMSVAADDIWRPAFAQFGVTQAKVDFNQAWIKNNGDVVLITAGIFEAVCTLDVLHYPFDEHVCVFEIIPASTDKTQIQLSVSHINTSKEFTLEHGEWEVKSSVLTIQEFIEPVSGKMFLTLLKSITISRRYLFTVVHTCIPLILLCVLNTVIFTVPLKSGERISFSTSILLNFVILTSSMSDDLPHNSLRLPYLSIAMTITNIITTIGVITSVILCRMSYETIVPVPETIKRLASKMLAFRLRIWGVKLPREDNAKNRVDTKDVDKISTTESVGSVEQSDSGIANQEITWSVFAELIDKVIFYLNLIAVFTAITVLSIFITNT